MQELLPCFRDWLATQRDEAKALTLLRALADESLKVAGSKDPQQLEFDALDLAQACDWPERDDFDAASKKIKSANLEKYLSSRTAGLEAYFAQRGVQHALRICKRSPSGRHRAQWSLESYSLVPPVATVDAQRDNEPVDAGLGTDGPQIEYEYAAAGTVRPSWLARPLLGNGWFRTKSLRGLLFVCTGLAPMVCVAGLVATVWLMLFVRRPVTTGDLALLVFAGGLSWVLWNSLRSLWWLLADRIIPVADVLLGWSEAPAQLESFKDGNARIIGLVRYSATCPVCAAAVELRYGEGQEGRRLFGCCVEAPQEHVFTFDRVTRRGRRVR
ncbi:hypothetical protein EJO66_22995 [Variovorax beijingensis]|uniref:Uncharacterized protein n=1 Tax=Variovorax beijingensis TaxID=2496117 RepID=A0ABY0A2C2_9BURK|nr:hypothetical protein EJO66_22995 [Variovorax beijingensis]